MTIDKITLGTVNKIDLDLIKAEYFPKEIVKRNFKIYRFDHSDHNHVMIKTFPPALEIATSYVEINPRTFGSYQKAIDFLKTIIVDFDINDGHKISRLDLCVDVYGYPLEYFKDCCNIKHKRHQEVYVSSSKSLVYGKPPQRITIYERDKRDPSLKDQVVTRVESQCRGDKLPIHRLGQAEQLINHNPFEKIYFLQTDYNYTEIKNRREAKNFAYLKRLVEQYGINDARRIINKDGHFARDYEKFLIRVNEPDLFALYQTSIKKLLDGFEMA